MKKLLQIQSELKAPKGQYNDFGKFKFRSCEDILEAVKPILKAKNCLLYLIDSLEYIGNRFYIKAEAILIDLESNEKVTSSAYAREDEVKKGMDGSQITGASSSYARKYALNGLFLIDDTKDSDTNEAVNLADKEDQEEVTKFIQTINKLILKCNELKIDLKESKTVDFIKKYTNGKVSIDSMNLKELKAYEKVLNAFIEKKSKEI